MCSSNNHFKYSACLDGECQCFGVIVFDKNIFMSSDNCKERKKHKQQFQSISASYTQLYPKAIYSRKRRPLYNYINPRRFTDSDLSLNFSLCDFSFTPFHRSFLFCHQYYIFFSDSCSNPALNIDEKKRIPEAISIADRLQTVLYYRIIKCPCAGITKLTVMEMSLTAKK